jgi:protein gp37
MSDNSKIEWTDASWNCVTGCTKVSPGCDNCYAETFAERWRGIPGHHFEQGFDVRLWPERLDIPRRWKRPRRIFVNSMSDVFHDAIPDSFLDSMFAVMADCPQHTFQVLTKRHARMRSYLSRAWPEPLPNVWIGVSAEDEKRFELRAEALLDAPAAVRFISAEPLIGPIRMRATLLVGRACEPQQGIGWVIAGGESGHQARPCNLEWLRSLRDQCADMGVPFFMKQAGAGLSREWGCSDRKGHNPSEWPESFPREFPRTDRVAAA